MTLWRRDGNPPAVRKEWTFPGPATVVAFSPGGDYLAVGDGDGMTAVPRQAADGK